MNWMSLIVKRLKTLFFLSFFLLLGTVVHAQLLRGKVVDAKSNLPLAFVNVVYTSALEGTISSIDGIFLVPEKNAEFIKLSYLGYQPVIITRQQLDCDSLVISMEQSSYELDVIDVMPGENPAEILMQKVIDRRDVHDPQQLDSYQYTSYHKFWVTVKDKNQTYLGDVDSTASLKTRILNEVRKVVDKQHFFITEAVSEKSFRFPKKVSEKIITSRVSGFQDPSLFLMSTQLQSFSIYENYFTLLDQNYLSPVGKNAMRNYFYWIEDTLVSAGRDTTFVVSFRPRKGKKFEGLKGALHVNTNGYAIQSVLAAPNVPAKGNLNISIRQQYDLLPCGQWFPVELETEASLNLAAVSQIDSVKNNAQVADLQLIGRSKTYLMNRRINPPLSPRIFGVDAISVSKEAGYSVCEKLDQYRVIPLSAKDSSTYHLIDSLGKANKFDRKIEQLEILLGGKFPLGPVNIDYSQLVGYSNYEGLKVGMGVETNRYFSRYFSVGGFVTHTFGSRQLRHGEWFNIYPTGYRDFSLYFGYRDENLESGGSYFFSSGNVQGGSMMRELLVDEMYFSQHFTGGISFRPLPEVRINLLLDRSDNQFEKKVENEVSEYIGNYKLTKAGIQLRYAPGETTLRTPTRLYELTSSRSVWFLNYYKGLNWFDSDYHFGKLEISGRERFRFTPNSTTNISVRAAKIWGDAPYPERFNGNGGFTTSFNILAPYSFATMRMNEFTTDQYASIYIRHNMGQLLSTRNGGFQPELLLAHNMGIGKLDADHSVGGLPLKDYPKGYFESGVEINNLLPLGFVRFGFGVYRRYGAYRLPESSDNWAYKLGIFFNL